MGKLHRAGALIARGQDLGAGATGFLDDGVAVGEERGLDELDGLIFGHRLRRDEADLRPFEDVGVLDEREASELFVDGEDVGHRIGGELHHDHVTGDGEGFTFARSRAHAAAFAEATAGAESRTSSGREAASWTESTPWCAWSWRCRRSGTVCRRSGRCGGWRCRSCRCALARCQMRERDGGEEEGKKAAMHERGGKK
jgi:hypothetical protein